MSDDQKTRTPGRDKAFRLTDPDAKAPGEPASDDTEGHMPMRWSNRDLKEDIEPLVEPDPEPAKPAADDTGSDTEGQSRSF